MCRRRHMCRQDERPALETDRGRSRRPDRTLRRSRTSTRHRRSIDPSVPWFRQVRQASPYTRTAAGTIANSRELSTVPRVADRQMASSRASTLLFHSTDDSAANETAESITNSARSADRLDALRTVRVVIMLLHSRKSVTPGEPTGDLASSSSTRASPVGYTLTKLRLKPTSENPQLYGEPSLTESFRGAA